MVARKKGRPKKEYVDPELPSEGGDVNEQVESDASAVIRRLLSEKASFKHPYLKKTVRISHFEAIAYKMIQEARKGKGIAADWLADRGFGKPKSGSDSTGVPKIEGIAFVWAQVVDKNTPTIDISHEEAEIVPEEKKLDLAIKEFLSKEE